MGDGLDLGRLAWLAETQAFSIQSHDLREHFPNRPKTAEMKVPTNKNMDFLNRNQVEVLLVDEGDRQLLHHPIEKWIERATGVN